MRYSLYKYYDRRQWADAFLDGKIRFRSLSYFRDYEDAQVRGDKNEGKMIFRPEDGLVITNHTQGWTKKTASAFNATVHQEEIFVFCLSRLFTDELRETFKAVACVEILNIKALCDRIESALPAQTAFPGKPGRERIGRAVMYYEETDNCNPTWACPDMIATLSPKPSLGRTNIGSYLASRMRFHLRTLNTNWFGMGVRNKQSLRNIVTMI